MKKSSDWVRQPGLDKKLDQLVEERGCMPAELVTHDAAKALGIEPSGAFYKKGRDWKQRRAAEHDGPVMEVPSHVPAEFREVVNRLAAEAMSSFVRAVRGVGGDLDRVVRLHITDASRRADEAQAEVNGLIDQWTSAEAQRDAALARIVELEHALADAQRDADVTAVRLQERDRPLKALSAGDVGQRGATVPSVVTADRASVGNGSDRPAGNVSIDANTVSGCEPVFDVGTDVSKQPPVSEIERLKIGQAEMPVETRGDGDKAESGDPEDADGGDHHG